MGYCSFIDDFCPWKGDAKMCAANPCPEGGEIRG